MMQAGLGKEADVVGLSVCIEAPLRGVSRSAQADHSGLCAVP